MYLILFPISEPCTPKITTIRAPSVIPYNFQMWIFLCSRWATPFSIILQRAKGARLNWVRTQDALIVLNKRCETECDLDQCSLLAPRSNAGHPHTNLSLLRSCGSHTVRTLETGHFWIQLSCTMNSGLSETSPFT